MTAALKPSVHLDHLPVQVWTARSDGSLDFVNAAVASYFGVPRQQLLEHGWKDVCHPFDLIEASKKWQQSLLSGAPYEILFRLLRGSDRQFRWHVGRASPVFSLHGTIDCWIGCNTDVDALTRDHEVALAAASHARADLERELRQAQLSR